MNIEEFTASLTALKDFATLQGGYVTKKDIEEAFPDLTDDQFGLIEEYLKNNRIGIDEPIDSDEFLSADDNKYLEMYMDDINSLDEVSDDMKRVLTMNVLAGEGAAKEKLINAYLRNVVDVAKLYAGQGAPMADLIGEGNVALAIAVDMLDCVESPEDADALIIKNIMNAMEEYVGIESEEQESEKKALALVIKVTDKAKEMNEELLRKITVDELVGESKISRKKILEAIRISPGCLEYIEKPEDIDE